MPSAVTIRTLEFPNQLVVLVEVCETEDQDVVVKGNCGENWNVALRISTVAPVSNDVNLEATASTRG